jgi:hypothetical protein
MRHRRLQVCSIRSSAFVRESVQTSRNPLAAWISGMWLRMLNTSSTCCASSERNQELQDAEAVLRTSEAELASQLSAAAGRLLPLVQKQQHGTR